MAFARTPGREQTTAHVRLIFFFLYKFCLKKRGFADIAGLDNYFTFTPLRPCGARNLCTTSADCGQNSSCLYSGVLSCECNEGFFSPNNTGMNCVPSNPCASNASLCGSHATCRSLVMGEAFCVCNIGYMQQGIMCVVINQCVFSNGGCSANATCVQVGSGVNCTCNQGYTGNGTHCGLGA